MYDFLEKGISYELLTPTEQLKARFLEESGYYSSSTKRSYWSIYRSIIEDYEDLLEKGIEYFSRDEIILLVKNYPNIREGLINSLNSFISRYRLWCAEEGINTNDVAQTIDFNKVKSLNKTILRNEYQNLQEFYMFIGGLKGSPIDKMLLILFRYGLNVFEIINLKWTDIDYSKQEIKLIRNDKLITIHTENTFFNYLEECRLCSEYITDEAMYSKTGDKKKYLIQYESGSYVIKRTLGNGLSQAGVYTKIKIISDNNQLKKISINTLRLNYKLDLLLQILNDNQELTNKDIGDVILRLDGSVSNTKIYSLKKLFVNTFDDLVEKKNSKTLTII